MDNFFDLAPEQTPSSGLPYVRKMSKKVFERIWHVWEKRNPVQRVRVTRNPDGDIIALQLRVIIPLAPPKDDVDTYVLYLVHTVFKPVVQRRLPSIDKEKS